MSDIKITILGAGGWAIGLATVLSDNGHDITMWSAVDDEIEELSLKRTNERCLPGIVIPETIKLTEDISIAVDGADIIILAVASKFIRSTAARLKGIIKDNTIVVNVAKGIEEGTCYTMGEIISEELPGARVCVLSGPSHAEEVARRMPTTVVVSGPDEETFKFLQEVFSSKVFRVYGSRDMLGMEIGGSLKNIIALAAGILDGIGYGDNIKAALITRGIKEIAALAVAMGAREKTLYGLSGIGDLIVTCASMNSRNRRAGILIGQGKSMEEACREVNQVVEGVVSAKAALELSEKYGVTLPIVEQVNKVLFDGMDPSEALTQLMLRETKNE